MKTLTPLERKNLEDEITAETDLVLEIIDLLALGNFEAADRKITSSYIEELVDSGEVSPKDFDTIV